MFCIFKSIKYYTVEFFFFKSLVAPWALNGSSDRNVRPFNSLTIRLSQAKHPPKSQKTQTQGEPDAGRRRRRPSSSMVENTSSGARETWV